MGQLESGSFKINMESFNIITMIDQSLSKFELQKRKESEIQMVETDWKMLSGTNIDRASYYKFTSNAVNHCDVGGLIDITVQEEMIGSSKHL